MTKEIIVTASGYFDPIHIGHIEYLELAKKHETINCISIAKHKGGNLMEISALASGSSGNCFYVADKDTAILIDAGISAKQTLQRLQSINENPAKIRGIFITHEHIDHIRGADVLARKLNIPIYATKATAKEKTLCSDKKLIKIIGKNDSVTIDGLRVESFSKSHSAADPVSYNVYGSKKVSIITDAGKACDNIKKHVSDCDFLFIEAN